MLALDPTRLEPVLDGTLVYENLASEIELNGRDWFVRNDGTAYHTRDPFGRLIVVHRA